MKKIAFLVLATLIFGCTSFAPAEKTRLELRLVASGPGPGFSEMRTLGASQPVFVSNIPVITNVDIAHARATRYADVPAVALTFTKMAANKFCDITSANIGKPMGGSCRRETG